MRRDFAHVDHAFTRSAFLLGVYRESIRLASTPLEPPLDWSTVVAPVESRAFVTFVNPSPHKGLFLFARLADMLGSRCPDIPVLVVQSGQSGGSLNNIPGIDFSRYPQLMAAPPVPTPREYLALTRILLVPSGSGRSPSAASPPPRPWSTASLRLCRIAALCQTSLAAKTRAAVSSVPFLSG